MSSLDPILAEVLRNALISIAREMKLTVLKTAYSSTVQEGQDFSVALFERDRLVAQAEGIGVHLGALPYAVQLFLKQFPYEKLEPGDVFIFNDPFCGGVHTPDVTVIKPCKIGSLLFLPMVRAHWSDVGGMAPGSITGEARSIFQEGLRLPFIRLYQRGELIESVRDLILANVRLPEQRAGDLRAQVAACNVAEDRLKALVDKYGEETASQGITSLLDSTEARTRSKIGQLPDGCYEYEDYLDNDGHSEEPVRIHAKVNKKGSDIEVDFQGTSAQTEGPTNATLAVTVSGTVLALKCILDPFWPANEGFFRPIAVKAEPGTCVNALPPAPTGSCWEVASRVIDCIIGALASAVPDRIAASWCGSINHTFIGGTNSNGKPYVWYEYPVGGRGATSTGDGENALARMTAGDTKDLAVERAEAEFPLLCTRYELRQDSGGPGLYQGGLGLRKEMLVLGSKADEQPVLSTIWDRCKIPPYGLGGGLSGRLQRLVVVRSNGERIELKGRVSFVPLSPGDTVCMETGGGGGFGDFLLARPEDVVERVRRGYISPEVAREIYGVAITCSCERMTVDYLATQSLRERLQKNRVKVRVSLWQEKFIGERRTAGCHEALLKALNLPEGGLVEIIGRALSPLRVWLVPERTCGQDAIMLDAVALRILGVLEGDEVWARSPFWSTTLETGEVRSCRPSA